MAEAEAAAAAMAIAADKLRRSRRATYAAIKKKYNELSTIIENENGDKGKIAGIKAYMENTLPRINKLNDDLAFFDSSEEDMNKDAEQYSEIQSDIGAAIALCTNTGPSNENVNGHENGNIRLTQPNKVKLPQLDLPVFDGDPLHFHSFWERFNVIHADTAMVDATKFAYLSNQLKGKAKDLIAGFASDRASYSVAVEMLKEKFGDERKILDAHFHALRNVTNATAKYESLQSFHAETERILRQLESLGVSFEAVHLSILLTQILSEKLPRVTMANMNRSKGRDVWSLESFRIQLKREVELQEDTQSTTSKFAGNEAANENQTVGRRNLPPTAASLAVTSQSGSNKRACAFCNYTNHVEIECRKFPSPNERKAKAYEDRRCYRCLKTGHPIAACRSNYSCDTCKGTDHHTALCNLNANKGSFWSRQDSAKPWRDNKGTAGQARPFNQSGPQRASQIAGSRAAAIKEASNIGSQANATVSAMTSTSIDCMSIAIPTARLQINNKNEVSTTNVRALFDLGSQRTFITAAAAKNAELTKVSQVYLALDGFGSQGQRKLYDLVSTPINTSKGIVEIDALIIDHLPSRLRTSGLKNLTDQWSMDGQDVADSFENDQKIEIQMLIGGDNYYKFVQSPMLDGVPIIKSTVGIMASGCVRKNGPQDAAVSDVITSLRVCVHEEPGDVDFLWKMEQIGIDTKEAHPNDKLALQDFKESICYKDGRYVARLPWKPDHPRLPTNFALAKGRLEGNLKRLRKNPEQMQQYSDVINEQIENKFIEEVINDTSRNTAIHYLAHHAVKKDSLTTPLRIVFDCSAHGKDTPSLNDCLYSGPNLMPEMTQVLMRFRLNKYAVTADIRKAFLMIGLDERDRDATRFLWPENPSSTDSKLKVYRFRAVLFGATCSQFILNATIQHHLQQAEQNEVHASRLSRNLYVDNVFGTGPNERSIMEFHADAKELLQDAGLQLRDWATNAKSPQEVMRANSELDARPEVPVLGLRWQTAEDCLSLATRKTSNNSPTKRNILSGLASQFDPLGVASPITLKAKILMQDIWRTKVGWDDPLSEEIVQQWKEISLDFEKIGDIKFSRHSICEGTITLHAFADASIKAYGAVVYAVQNGRSEFVFAKTRVAPVKNEKLSIPKLELAATTIAARIVNYVQEAYEVECNVDEIHLWSDSQVALGWIHASKALPPYVQNRVDEVRKRVPNAKWHYVPTKDNPADILSRGCKVSQLKSNELWWHGPKWITINPLPNDPLYDPIISTLSKRSEITESNAQICSVQTSKNKDESVCERILENCGSYIKAVRVVAWIKRYLGKRLRPDKEKKNGKTLSNEEITDAEQTLLTTVQREAFKEELAYLTKPAKDTVPPLVKQLNLNLRSGFIVCETRLKEAHIAEHTKFPILLPSKNRFTELIILHVHKENMHLGIAATLAHMRQRWWIPKARQRIKSVLAKCVICRRYHGAAYPRPPAPPLPSIRVQESRPFAVVGIDYGGPLNTKNNGITTKRYIALYTCAVTRAIHLELARDLSAEAFLQTFQRFVSRRSYPSVIISDNGTNFVSGADTLKSWESNPEVRHQLNQMKCQWRFIPKRAPWFGGIYERLIGMTKMTLRKVLGRTSADDEELQTLLCRIEAQLNDRPLTYVSNQLGDAEPLTPSMLLQGHRHVSMPMPTADPDEIDDPSVGERETFTKRQQHIELTLQGFWRRWSTEYLTMLRHDKQRGGNSPPPKVGQVVLIHDEGKRMWWRMGKIRTLHHGKDGHVRSADIDTAHGTTSRPVVKLYPLEVFDPTPPAENDRQDEADVNGAKPPRRDNINSRPSREAARKANLAIKEQCDVFAAGDCDGY